MPDESNTFNAVNRGVYIADNLPFLRSLNDECIDLAVIDPPFAKNETFTRDKLKPPLTPDEAANERRLLASWNIHNEQDALDAGIEWPDSAFVDKWSWDKDVHEDWVHDLEAHWPAISSLIETTRRIHSDSTAAYLCYMAIRLIELHRVLAPTGSLYLHCDHTANAYIRQLLDGIFGNGEDGKPGFRNEIVWCYKRMAAPRQKRFSRCHDTILYYAKGLNITFNPDEVRLPYSESSLERAGYQKTSLGGAAPKSGICELNGGGDSRKTGGKSQSSGQMLGSAPAIRRRSRWRWRSAS